MYFGDQFSINRIYFRDSAVCSLAPVETGPRAVAARGPGAGRRAGEGQRQAAPPHWTLGVAPPSAAWAGRREVSVGLVAGGAGVRRPVALREDTW